MNNFGSKYVLAGVLSLALPCGAALADATIKLSLAGEAFEGPPKFEVRIDGKAIGGGVLDQAIDTGETGRLFASAKPRSYLQQFVFEVPASQFSQDAQISIALINDKYLDEEVGRDRNLFIDSVTVNGLEIPAADLTLLDGEQEQVLDYQAGLMPVYESTNLAVAAPPPSGWPMTDITLSLAEPIADARLVAHPLPRPRPANLSLH